MIHDIKKVYENTIIKEKGENKEEQKENRDNNRSR